MPGFWCEKFSLRNGGLSTGFWKGQGSGTGLSPSSPLPPAAPPPAPHPADPQCSPSPFCLVLSKALQPRCTGGHVRRSRLSVGWEGPGVCICSTQEFPRQARRLLKLVPETPQRPRKRRGRTSTPQLTRPSSSFLPPFLPPLGRCPPLPRPGGLWGRTAGRVGTLRGTVSGGKVPHPRRYCLEWGGHTSRRSCRSQGLLIKVLKSGLSLAGNASAQRRGMLAALLENVF